MLNKKNPDAAKTTKIKFGRRIFSAVGLVISAGFLIGCDGESDNAYSSIENATEARRKKVERSATDIAKELQRSTVKIEYYWEEEDALVNDVSGGFGTGVIVDKDEDGDYWILTNAHVLGYYNMIASDDDGVPEIITFSIDITLHDGSKTKPIALLDHKRYDCSLLCISGAIGDYPLAARGDVLPDVGEKVYAMGHPMGLDYTFTTGMVSAVRDESNDSARPFHQIQTDTSINPGNSGGPLANVYGEVVGINTSGVGDTDSGLNFALSISDILRDLENDQFYLVPLDIDSIRTWVKTAD